ncbi:replicative DNA helicase [Pseudomonas migulae]|uniref:replicative DNA helicase n=1 Tax=Pseudomonas migulae TaxID=78543 RepID=UPI003721C6CF
MRDPYSVEAEHGLLGAMMQRPELIDTLSDDLSAESFYFPENADVYRAIMAVRSAGQAVDFLTVGNHIGTLATGTPAFAYCAEIVKNTPSVASAGTYAAIVRERAIDRALYELGSQAMEISQGDQDTQTKIAAIQTAAMAIDSGSGADEVVKASDVLIEQVEVWQERHDRYERGETLIGLSTGLTDLDEKLGGLQPEQLIIVAGRPAMGKTTLAMGFAINAAVHQNKSSLVVSLEMSKGQLLDRAIASEGKIPLGLMKNGTACESHGAQMTAASHMIRKANLFFADRSGATVGRIRSLARRHKMRYGLDLLVIDYLQLMEGEGGNRTEEVSGMSRGCKLLARELGIPVVLLSQLSRKCEERPNKRPVPSDLRESGAIEQDADVILFVYRDEVYHENSEYKGIAEIIIGKGRDVETGTVRAAFIGQYNRFENLAAGWKAEPVEASSKVTPLANRYAKKERF